MKHYDVIILGAGGAGLMCAAQASQNGKNTLLLDHANKRERKFSSQAAADAISPI